MPLSYTASPFPVRSDLEQTHQRVWESVAQPGTWWSAAERIQIAREARAARAADGLATAPAGPATAELPAAAVEVARRVGGAPKSIDRDWFDGLVPAQLEDTHYVEVVGVVVRTVSVDVFCRGLGIPLHAYPEPESGQPSRKRPTTAVVDEAWVPMIPNGRAGGEEAKATFGGTSANVIRALSLVPAEVRGISDVGNHQYLTDRHVLDPKHDPGRAISRAQIELVAGRISAINECFY